MSQKIFLLCMLFLMLIISGCQTLKKVSVMQTEKIGEFILIEGGYFTSGFTKDQEISGRFTNSIQEVRMNSFYLGKTELTQDQWVKVMGSNPSVHKCPKCPVENISEEQINVFLSKINTDSRYKYRLPSTLEWEYAARGGIMDIPSKYPGSNKLDELAWYSKNSNDSTHEVGLKKPNELGLYDMAGNVREFCKDSTGGIRIDGEALKGGFFRSDSDACKPCHSFIHILGDLYIEEKDEYSGFRLLLEIAPDKK